MFSFDNDGAGRDIGKTLVIAVLAFTLITSSGGLAVGLGVIDGGDSHAGVALAQSEEDSDGRGPAIASGDSSDENESGDDDSPQTPMGARADSQVQDTPEEQAAAEAEAANETATDTRADSAVGNTTNASTGDEFRSGDDDDFSGAGPWFVSMIRGVTNQASQEFGGAVETLMEFGVTRAAPGEASFDAMDTWTSPDDPLWQGSLDGMSISRGIGFILTIFAMWWAFTTYGVNPRTSKQTFVYSIASLIFLARPAFWTALSIHLTNGFSAAIVPGQDTFATPEGMLLVLSSALIAGIFAAGSIGVVVLAIAVTALAHNATYLTMALLPLAAGLYPWPAYFRSTAKMIVYFHGMLLMTSPIQALGSLIMIRMFFGATGAGVLESFAGVVAFVGLVYLVYYKMLKELAEKAFDAPITHLGVQGARVSFDGIRNTKTTITNAPEMFKNARNQIESGIGSARETLGRSDPAPSPSPTRRTVGQLGTSGGGSRSTAARDTGRSPRVASGFNAQSRPEPQPASRERDRIDSGFY